ncbi:MAG: hypothetical protein F6K65_37180, partial [Moorea sp. SIO3C2]|nr:hypothetical protein [Moorena sp. SIO3C2]
MEALTTAAVAIGSVVATKAIEKTGEKVGEAVWDATSRFLESIRKQSPDTVIAIDKYPEEPLDYAEV